MEENNKAWKMLLKCLDEKEEQITTMKKREINLLQQLMKTEENVKELIKVIANKTFVDKSEPAPPETPE